MALWTSTDTGAAGRREGTAAADGEFNHSDARRPVDAAPGFSAFWADGHGRAPSRSSLYFFDRSTGAVRRLPRTMTGERAEPTFLISKPFRPEMVKAVISQALFFDLKARRH